jgi:hypothetical protein
MAHCGNAQMPPRLTITTPMLDIGTEWTLNASLTISSSYKKCSKRRTLGHSAQATSPLPIEGTTKCSRIAGGFSFGRGTGVAAEVKPKAGFGFRASAASQSRSDSQLNSGVDFHHPKSRRFSRRTFLPIDAAGLDVISFLRTVRLLLAKTSAAPVGDTVRTHRGRLRPTSLLPAELQSS